MHVTSTLLNERCQVQRLRATEFHLRDILEQVQLQRQASGQWLTRWDCPLQSGTGEFLRVMGKLYHYSGGVA